MRDPRRFDRSNARLLDGFVVHYEKGLPDPARVGVQHIDYGFSIIDRDVVMPLITHESREGLAELQALLQRVSRR